MRLFFLTIISFLSCLTGFAQDRQKVDVSTFTGINLKGSSTLYLRQGTTQEVVLEGNRDYLDRYEAKVEGGVLVLGLKRPESNWSSWTERGDITILVTMRDVESLVVSGSGKIVGRTLLRTDDLVTRVSGSGTIEAEIYSDDVQVNVSGSGTVRLTGNCDGMRSQVTGSGNVRTDLVVSGESSFTVSGSGSIAARGKTPYLEASISGSGRIDAPDLEAERCEVRISGSGGMNIHVTRELNANISGSGHVNYSGNPQKVNSNASGSGKVRKI